MEGFLWEACSFPPLLFFSKNGQSRVKLTALANSKMSFVLSVNFSEFEHQIDFANTEPCAAGH